MPYFDTDSSRSGTMVQFLAINGASEGVVDLSTIVNGSRERALWA